LVRAYAAEFSAYFPGGYPEAVQTITAAESEFRKTTILYGQALTQNEEVATQLISEQLVAFANELLQSKGITLPPETDLTPLIRFAIGESVQLCADDYAREVADTIRFVDRQLKRKGIVY
jgi:hypothetical protein